MFSARNCTREGQIKCADGIQCIWETRVCDGYSSCLDGSDEGDHCLGNTYALLIVYLIFYHVNDMKSVCIVFILRRHAMIYGVSCIRLTVYLLFYVANEVSFICLIVQWNLSNPTHHVIREMCRIVQDVGILRFYFS